MGRIVVVGRTGAVVACAAGEAFGGVGRRASGLVVVGVVAAEVGALGAGRAGEGEGRR